MRPLILLAILLTSVAIMAQNNVAINTTGADADSSAILDVQSTNKGMLVPRMSSTQRNMISNAAIGLLVYDLTTESFWFKDSQGWVELVDNARGLRDKDTDTRVEVESTPDSDKIELVAGGVDVGGIDSSGMQLQGRLGIGLASPAHPLHARIDGLDSVATIVAMLQSPVSGRPVLQFSESTNNTSGSGMSIEYNGAAGNGPDNEMYINGLGGVPVVTFENDGETGIGTTQPNAKLHVQSNSAGTYPQLLLYENSATDYARLNFQNQSGISRWTIAGKTSENATDTELNFFSSLYGGDVMNLRGDGRVGIGTNNPQAWLHINSAINENPFRVQSNGSTKLYVQSNGGTSLGSTNTPPVNGLHVEGDIQMDGDDITSSTTLRLNSDTRIELVVGTNTVVIDPVSGITISSDSDITFDAGNDIIFNANDFSVTASNNVNVIASGMIDLAATGELELNSGTITDMNIGSTLQMNAQSMIDLVAGSELELNGATFDFNSSGSIDIDGTTIINLDAATIGLNTSGGGGLPVIHSGSQVINPPCGSGCIGILNLGSATVLVGN